MSESTEEKVGLILGKLEAQGEYMRSMNHSMREQTQATQASLMDLKDRMDEAHKELRDGQKSNSDRLAEMEGHWSLVRAIGKWFVGLLTAVGIAWISIKGGNIEGK